MPKGQEGQEAQEPKEFIEKFKRISTESILRQFEVKHRDYLEDPPSEVRTAFNAKWKEHTGSLYWQRITTVPQIMAPFDGRNDTRRSDPKGNRYRERLLFDHIFFMKVRRKQGKKIKDFFIIDGIVAETDTKRPIFGGLSVERLYDVFGDKTAAIIINDSKKEPRGNIKADIEIDVEAYWEVQFAPQKDGNDTKAVELTVEGNSLRMLRMEKVIMPGFYLENSDNTTKDIFSHESGEGRKVVGKVQKYPYTVLRQATMEEFLAFKEVGNQKQRKYEADKEGVA